VWFETASPDSTDSATAGRTDRHRGDGEVSHGGAENQFGAEVAKAGGRLYVER